MRCGLFQFLFVVLLAAFGRAQQFRELPNQPLPPVGGVQAVAIGDVDGDGDVDIVLGTIQRQNTLLLNDGFGRFTDVSSTRLPADRESTTGIVFVDVDGDGDLDIVCANAGGGWGTGQNRLYLNDGTGKFTDGTTGRLPTVGRWSVSVTVGDVDGDGDADLVIGNTAPGPADQDKLLLNDGRGKFTDVTSVQFPNLPTYTSRIALGDLDGDGDLDMIPGTYHTNSIWMNDGRGKFTAVATNLPKFSSYVPVLGDVDADGDLDLVYAWTGPNWLYLNDGKGRFTRAPTAFPNYSLNSRAVALGDVDGDGDLDAVFANVHTHITSQKHLWQNEIYLNDGRGKFTDVTSTRFPTDSDNTVAVALGDLDRDGDADIVFANMTKNTRLYVNLHRQVNTPDPAKLGAGFRIDLYAKPGYATAGQVAILAANLTPATPRIPIPSFGSFGLGLTGLIIHSPIPLPTPAGFARLPVVIPNDVRLLGQRLYLQALTVHSPTTSVARLTNVTADPFVR